jgi:predicted nuclease of restriction endonuclease-like (RecB) superfamily
MKDKNLIKIDGHNLFDRVVSILEEARSNVVKAVNSNMVIAYWLIGREIIQEIQDGDKRAKYGKQVIKELSSKLNRKYNGGFSVTNLQYFRQFYLTFQEERSIHHTPCGKSEDVNIQHTLRGKFTTADIPSFSPKLSWSHFRALMRVDKLDARKFYEEEAVSSGWTQRQLERQINSFYYERLLSSKNKKEMLLNERTKQDSFSSTDILKSPSVLEFLNIPEISSLHESKLEQAIIDNMQSFLLELGKGFAFVARQKRVSTETKHFYIDLVFYNYILNCFVLIDLKTKELTHQDVGQMDMYVRMYNDLEKSENDNPTVGIILCSEKDETIVKYSVLNENKKLFASKYLLYLPTEEELKRELERERHLAELEIAKQKDSYENK